MLGAMNRHDAMTDTPLCDLPPRGWYCNLLKGHDGPCPTWVKFWYHPIIWVRDRLDGF